MGYTIRPFTMDRYHEVIALWRRCEGIGLSEADSPRRIKDYLRRNPGMSYIAVHETAVVAAVMSGHDGRRGFIHHLAVDAAHRHRGLGRMLMKRCLASLQAAGIEKAHLFVMKHNQRGKAFWRALGWEERVDITLMSRRTADGARRER